MQAALTLCVAQPEARPLASNTNARQNGRRCEPRLKVSIELAPFISRWMEEAKSGLVIDVLGFIAFQEREPLCRGLRMLRIGHYHYA